MSLNEFDISEKWLARAGSGYGIAQSHMLGELRWNPVTLCKSAWIFEELALLTGEPLDRNHGLNPDDPESQVALLVQTVGALQRFAKIATCRSFRILMLSKQTDGLARHALIAVASGSQSATKACWRWLLDGLGSPPATPADWHQRFFSFQESIQKFSTPGANSWRTLQAAYDEKLPVIPFFDHASFIGTGCHRRAFKSFITDKTSYLGMLLAQDKHKSSRLLRSYGLPAAVNVLVKNQEQAVAAAEKIGYPVVVKPNDKDQGVGVCANIVSEPDLISAFLAARQHSENVLVEKFQPGFTHRFSVIDGIIVRVAKHVGFGVHGDGQSTIRELVDVQAQQLESQKRSWAKPATAPRIDDEAEGLLRQQGLTPEHVPANGEYVRLRRRDNVSAGGQRITLDNQEVHPDNFALALNACKFLTLDLAGIDLISPDVSRSWRDVPATICEVNGNPQLVARDDPDMYKRVLRHLMHAPCRIPTTLVVLPDRGAVWSKHLDRILPTSSHVAGISNVDGVWLNGHCLGGPFQNGFVAARALLTNSSITDAHIVMTIAEITQFGLPVDQLDTVFLPWKNPPGNSNDILKKWKNFLNLLKPHVNKFKIYNSQ